MVERYEWERTNEAFVWTAVEGRAYRLLGINQNRSGIYVNGTDYHQSFHASGYSHTRWNRGNFERIPKMPFHLPPLRSIETHLS